MQEHIEDHFLFYVNHTLLKVFYIFLRFRSLGKEIMYNGDHLKKL